MKITIWGHEYNIVSISRETYRNNGNLALQLWCEDTEYGGVEPFATLTVNLGKALPEKNQAFIDVNNNPWAPEFIEKYNLGRDTGRCGFSGYCVYPLYEMNLEEIDKYKEIAA